MQRLLSGFVPPPRAGLVAFTSAVSAIPISDLDFQHQLSDQDALELLEQDWTTFRDETFAKKRNEFRAIVNLSNKLRFQNLSILKDCEKLENFAVECLTQNYDLVDLVEESMAKTLQYERLLHKNGIRVPSLENTVESSSGTRKTVDKAPIKYTE